MERTPVKSSHLVSMGWGYVDERSCLEVEFNNGQIFRYFDVPEYHFLTMTNAPVGMSVGNYFNTYVKVGYPMQRLEEPVNEHFVMSNTVSMSVAGAKDPTVKEEPVNVPTTQPASWLSRLDDREQHEVNFARVYAKEFHHGTTGHNQLMIIAKLADLLDQAEGIKV